MSRVSVNAILQEIRILIAKECEKISAVKSKRVRVISVQGVCVASVGVELARKRLCFYFVLHTRNCKQKGLLKRNCCVYTQLVKHCSAKELLPIIKDFSELKESEIYSDGLKSYDGLVDFGAKAHYRVKHSKNEFANGRNHINGIENFGDLTKARLSQFHGIKKEFFYLHLKETEFRYNVKVKNENLYKILLKLITKNPM